MLESDLLQFYNTLLNDLFDLEKPHVTARFISNLAFCLPEMALTKKRFSNTRLDLTQHLLFDILDTLNQTTFQSSITAASMAGKEYKSVQEDRPKRLKRPVYVEAKPKFMTVKQLRRKLAGLPLDDD